MFSYRTGTKLAFENKSAAVGFDYTISVVNLGFVGKAMSWNHMGTKLAYKNQFEGVGFFYSMISNKLGLLWQRNIFKSYGNTIDF